MIVPSLNTVGGLTEFIAYKVTIVQLNCYLSGLIVETTIFMHFSFKNSAERIFTVSCIY